MTYTVSMKSGYYQVTVKDQHGNTVKVVTATTKIEALRKARF